MITEPLPFIDDFSKKPNDGCFEKKFRFCELNFNQKCINHYNNVSEKEGAHICPYGFSTIVKKIGRRNKIFTSIEVEKTKNKNEIKKRRHKIDNKKNFSIKEIRDLLDWYASLSSEMMAKQNILTDYNNKSSKIAKKEEVLDDTLHELRKLNNVLKKQAFDLKKHIEKGEFDPSKIELRSKNILSTSQLISVRLNAYDFTLNPASIENNQKTNLILYRKFEKAKHCLETLFIEKQIQISFNGVSHCLQEFYDIIEILPFILFENAIKYAPNESAINCTFSNSENTLKSIKIINESFLPSEDEIPLLFEKKVRGKNTDRISGGGVGLYTAKLICEYNNINININVEEQKKIEGKSFGYFVIQLDIL